VHCELAIGSEIISSERETHTLLLVIPIAIRARVAVSRYVETVAGYAFA